MRMPQAAHATGRVHQAVEPTEVRDRGGHRPLDALRISDVDVEGQEALRRAKLRRHATDPLAVEISQRDLCADSRKLSGGRSPDPIRSPTDQNDSFALLAR